MQRHALTQIDRFLVFAGRDLPFDVGDVPAGGGRMQAVIGAQLGFIRRDLPRGRQRDQERDNNGGEKVHRETRAG